MAETIEGALIDAGIFFEPKTGDTIDRFVVDADNRSIYVPQTEKLFGVESDKNVVRKYFTCPRIVGDNIDLFELSIRINWQNAGGEKDVYVVDDVTLSEDGEEIYFSWLVSRKLAKYKGTIRFIMCAVRATGEVIENEWNTTIATGEVIEGLEAESVITPEESDILTQLINMAVESSNMAQKAVEGVQDASQKVDEAVKEALDLKTQLQGLIKQAQDIVDSIDERVLSVGVDFEKTQEPINIETGDTIPTAFGKIATVFDSLGEAATYGVTENIPVTEQDGEVLLSGKAVSDAFGLINISGKSISDNTPINGGYTGNNITEFNQLGYNSNLWWTVYVTTTSDQSTKYCSATLLNYKLTMTFKIVNRRVDDINFLTPNILVTDDLNNTPDVYGGFSTFYTESIAENTPNKGSNSGGFEIGAGDWKSQLSLNLGLDAISIRRKRNGVWNNWTHIFPVKFKYIQTEQVSITRVEDGCFFGSVSNFFTSNGIDYNKVISVEYMNNSGEKYVLMNAFQHSNEKDSLVILSNISITLSITVKVAYL